MQQDHSKAIKGLSIATIVISALGLIFCLVIAGIFNAVMDMIASYGYDPLDGYPYYYDYYYYNDYFDYDEIAAMQIASVVANAFVVWACVCSIFTLVAGIIALRFGSDKNKLGMVFGWSIAGAVIGFIGSGLITAIIMIIIAVFANKDKNLYAAGYAPAAPIGGINAQVPPAQAAPVAPTAPVAPGAPVAPPAQVAPVAPAATIAPAVDNQMPTASEGFVAEPSVTVQIASVDVAEENNPTNQA